MSKGALVGIIFIFLFFFSFNSFCFLILFFLSLFFSLSHHHLHRVTGILWYLHFVLIFLVTVSSKTYEIHNISLVEEVFKENMNTIKKINTSTSRMSVSGFSFGSAQFLSGKGSGRRFNKALCSPLL